MQVKLQHMYQSHFEADPTHRTPPIPTAHLRLHHAHERVQELCYLAETTAPEREAVKTKLLHAVFELEHAVPAEHPVRSMVEGGSSDWMGNYIIKREFSECSHHIFGVTLPDLRDANHAADQAEQHFQVDLGSAAANVSLGYDIDSIPTESLDSSAVPHSNSSLASGSASGNGPRPTFASTTSWTLYQQLPGLLKWLLNGKAAVGNAASGHEASAALQPFIASSTDVSPDSPACANPDPLATELVTGQTNVPNSDSIPGPTKRIAGLVITPELDSALNEIADKLLHGSCGEGWLLQPRIANMSGLEYRVYMLGGASAVCTFMKLWSPVMLYDLGRYAFQDNCQ